MSLRELDRSTRTRLRWHGWVLTLWFIGLARVGFSAAAGWLLTRVAPNAASLGELLR